MNDLPNKIKKTTFVANLFWHEMLNFPNLYFHFIKKSIIRVVIYNSLWPDISRYFMVDLITPSDIDFMENVNEEGKERDGPLVFPGFSSHRIPAWDPEVYHTIIVIIFQI